MPQWGLTEDQRNTEPWGIPSEWLAASKVVTDPVHGDIFLNRLEVAIVDSSSFQRLRRIKQLGTVHLVYPGATHTRFSHSLGALRIAQDLMDIVVSQRYGPRRVEDLFVQWGARGDTIDELIAEAVTLARLGALLHDIGHVPFGHMLEDDLGLLTAHDANGPRLRAFWRALGDGEGPEGHKAVQRILRRPLKDALRPLILSKAKDVRDEPDAALRLIGDARDKPSYAFVADIVGNTICADLLDYLRRDHLYTGLPAALGRRFMNGFYVVRKADEAQGDSPYSVHYPERMTLRIDQARRERKDFVSELLKHLRFRYELQERVYSHHAKLAADAMLGKALGYWSDAAFAAALVERGGIDTREAFQAGRNIRELAEALEHDLGQRAASAATVGARKSINEGLEKRLRSTGDDAFVEWLGEPAPKPPRGSGTTADWAAWRSSQLGADLLARRLYKRAAQSRDASARERLHGLFRSSDTRERLLAQAVQLAEIDVAEVALWVPDPKMRLKTADVLVDYGSGIAPFSEYSPMGEEICRAHRALWAITVFIHPRYRDRPEEGWLLSALATLMGVEWDRCRPLGAREPDDWLVARVLVDEGMFSSGRSEEAERAVTTVRARLEQDYDNRNPALNRRELRRRVRKAARDVDGLSWK